MFCITKVYTSVDMWKPGFPTIFVGHLRSFLTLTYLPLRHGPPCSVDFLNPSEWTAGLERDTEKVQAAQRLAGNLGREARDPADGWEQVRSYMQMAP